MLLHYIDKLKIRRRRADLTWINPTEAATETIVSGTTRDVETVIKIASPRPTTAEPARATITVIGFAIVRATIAIIITGSHQNG